MASASRLRPADPNARRGLYVCLGLLVALCVALGIVGAVGDLPEIELRARPWAIALAIGATAIYLLLAVEVWRRLLADIGPTLPRAEANSVWFTSALGRYVPTALLYPVMRIAAGDRVGVPKRISLVALVYEVALTLVAALLISAYFVIDLPELAGEPARFLVVVIPVVGIVALHPRFFHRVTDRALVRFGREPLPVSLSMGRLLAYLVAFALTFIPVGLATYGIAEAVYPSIEGSDIPLITGAFAISVVLSMVAFILPGGIGAREATMVVALSPVMPTAPAIAVAILSRILQVATEVAFAIGFPLLVRRRARRRDGRRP